jgi:hypothetical protein
MAYSEQISRSRLKKMMANVSFDPNYLCQKLGGEKLLDGVGKTARTCVSG